MDGRQTSMHGHATIFGHVISTGAVIGSVAGWLPPISAFVALIWYLISIWETETVQGWVRRLRGQPKG